MTIQIAIKACLAQEGCFGRPASWKGTGDAIDLGRTLDTSKARRITPLGSSGGFMGFDWEVNPEELLGDWEVVTGEDLVREIGELDQED